MAKMDNKNVCRTCGEITRSSNAKNLFQEADEELLHRINLLTGFWLVYQDDMPMLICIYCQQDLKQAFMFRERCIAMQMKLEEQLQHQDVTNTQEFIAMQEQKQQENCNFVKEVDGVEEDPLIENQNSRSPSMQNEIEEIDEDSNMIACLLNSTVEYAEDTIFAEDQGKGFDDNSNHSDDSYFSIVDIAKQNLTYKQEQVQAQNATSPITSTQTYNLKIEPILKANRKYTFVLREPYNSKPMPESTDLIENRTRRPYRFINRKPRSTEPKKYKPTRSEYICEKCGKRYSTLFTFSEHKLYHAGVKNFKCGVCGMQFMTRRLLTHHSRRHTDERPYSCRICERTFRSRAHRNEHEKRHAHPTPYSCSFCDKSYTTAYHRDLHQADHNGVRKYHCEICERSFMTRKHLATHQKSKFHKQNVELFEKEFPIEKLDFDIEENS